MPRAGAGEAHPVQVAEHLGALGEGDARGRASHPRHGARGQEGEHAVRVDPLDAARVEERWELVPLADGRVQRLDRPVVQRPREARLSARHLAHPPSPSSCRTAMKASCGISTEPTCFIRFFPSFWRSRSFRLRVMSPP